MIPDRARPWLQAAIEAHKRPLWTMAEVEAQLAAHQARLWVGERSCILTEVLEYEHVGEKVMHVWLAGGDLSEIKQAITPIEAWARDEGCTQISIDGRAGWRRVMAPFGYEHETTSIRKFLT